MLTAEPYQVLNDCPHCRTEASVVMLMDPMHPACHMGAPATQRCRMCAWEVHAQAEVFVPRYPVSSGRCPNCTQPLPEAARNGEAPCPSCEYAVTLLTIKERVSLTDPVAARAAVSRWATEDQFEDPNAFCQVNMGGTLDEVVSRLQAGEVVRTSFDVIAYLGHVDEDHVAEGALGVIADATGGDADDASGHPCGDGAEGEAAPNPDQEEDTRPSRRSRLTP